jgi:3-oxoacyl-[acyl-carrier-protein] synthase III
MYALSQDLSIEGMKLWVSGKRLSHGDEVDVVATLRNPVRTIKSRAEVIWSSSGRGASSDSARTKTNNGYDAVGLKFKELKQIYREPLALFISKALDSKEEQSVETSFRRKDAERISAKLRGRQRRSPIQMSVFKTDTIQILGTGSYLPSKVVTNKDIIDAGLASSDVSIRRTLGAVERRAAAPSETNAEMMAIVARQILKQTQRDSVDLDRIICAGDPQDAIAPNMASMVQDLIGASCPAFDVQMSCAGWLCGMDIAARCMEGGEKLILVLASATVGSRLKFKNLMHRSIFGDGAGGVLFGAANGGESTVTGLVVDGKYGGKIFAPHSWSKTPDEVPDEYASSFFMSPFQEDFFEAMDFYLPPFVDGLLSKANLKMSEIDFFFLHQPSKPLFNRSVQLLEINPAKVFDSFERFGNLVAAEMPIYLDNAIRTARCRQGNRILMLAYGAGFTMAGAVIKI